MNALTKPGDFLHLNNSAVELERALIGTCMMVPGVFQVAATQVDADQFFENVHQHVWRAMAELAEHGSPINPITILPKLGNVTLDGGATLREYIAACAADTHCPAGYVSDFARNIREHWALRVLANDAADAHGAALSPGASAKSLISHLIQRLDETRAVVDGRRTGARSLGESATILIDRMQRQMVGEVIDAAMTTGLRSLDRKLGGGFKPGELIIVAGRPGMGKSTVAVSCARQMALAGHAGGFFSLEMPEAQIAARFVTDDLYTPTGATIEAWRILQGKLGDYEAQRAVDAERSFRDLPLFIDDSSNLTVGEVGARSRTLAQRFQRAGKTLEFIVIDYLKFLRSSERYRGQRVLEVGEITGGLKALAKDMGIAVILLAQLNRQVEQTQDKRPELSHLRDSGEIEQDADVVLLLFREAYYLANDPAIETDDLKRLQLDQCRNKLEIIIAKQRMGSTGKVDVFCHPGASAVRDL